MEQPSALDWAEHLESGRRYLKAASNGRSRPAVFTTDIIYHLTAMAVESFLVSVWQYNRQMPFDHTLEGLVDGLAPISPLDEELAAGVKAMSRFDDMCPLVPVSRTSPSDEEIQGMLAVAQRVEAFAGRQTETATGH